MFRPASTGLLQTLAEATADTRSAIRSSTLRDYLIGIAAAALATLARWLLDPYLSDSLPYPTCFVAVAVVSWSCGLLSSLVTVALSLLGANYFFVAPRFSLAIAEPGQRMGAIIFAGSALIIVLLGWSRRLLVDRAEQRRDLLRVTLASIGDGVVVTDAAGRVLFVNAMAEKLIGWVSAEAVSQPLDAIFRIVDERTRETVPNPAIAALQENRVVGLANHTLLIARDGTERPIDDSAAPIHGEHGRTVGSVLIFRDVGARRATERTLRDSATRTAAVLHSALDAIVTIDGQGLVVEMNPAAEDMFGYGLGEVTGRELAELLVPPELRARHRVGLARYLATGESKLLNERLEMPAQRKDGSLILVQLAITQVRGGAQPLFTGFMRDISQEKEAERQVYELVTELKRGARRKDEFLAMLSHELRNPLLPLRLSLDILKRAGEDPEMRRQTTQTMDRQLGHLERLVDDLLDVARITRDTLELRRSRVDLADIVRQAAEASQPLVQGARHELQVELPKQALPLDADPVRLVQVFSNLLNNACRYTPPGGRIAVRVTRAGDEATVVVSDNGQGIPADVLPRVFDMFMQAERSADRTAGLGIGLTLVKRLVEMHGGRITAASPGRDKGSEFVVQLPLLPEAALADRPAPTARLRPGTGKPRRILVVDDNVDSATALATILGLSGHEVRTAHDGPQALEVEADFRPDAVLLDIGLPAMSGHEVARRMRARSDGRRLLLVALTGWGQAEDRRKSSEAGFDHHMIKPVDIRALLDRLDQG